MTELPLVLIKVVLPFVVMFTILPVFIWAERKGSAFIQDRPGPNRANVCGIRMGGLLHPIADVFKLIFKEDIIPNHVNKFYFVMAPMISLSVACVTFLVIPYASTLLINGEYYVFQPANINAGILYTLAISSLGVYGIMLAGWSSNNKFALLGGLRSSAQMISYELSMGLAIVSIVLWSGSLGLGQIVADQGTTLWHWNFIKDPLAWIIFTVAAFAETNRTPFDLPEGESELVAGYHTEYSSMKFAMFFMAEYANMIVAAALMATLFFGGFQVPFCSAQMLHDNATAIVHYGLFGIGGVSALIGLALTLKFKRFYRDSRDFEVLVFGIPAILVGLGLIGFGVSFGQWPLSAIASNVVVVAVQAITLIAKVLALCWMFIWVRWTLPRIRYDHLMNLGWKFLLPLAMANVVLTTLRMYFNK